MVITPFALLLMGMMAYHVLKSYWNHKKTVNVNFCSGEKASQWQLAVEILHQMHFVKLSANAAWQLKCVTSLPLGEERATKKLKEFICNHKRVYCHVGMYNVVHSLRR